MQNPYLPSLWFRTNFFLADAFDGPRNLKVMEIVPAHHDKWTFTLLSAFLNEHASFKKAERRAFEQTTQDGTINQKFIFQNTELGHMKIYLQIVSTTISVKMTTSYIKQVWTRKYLTFASNLGKFNKTCITSRTQEHVYYDINYPDPKDGTKALFQHSPLIFNSLYDFSDIFHYFCKKLSTSSFPKDEDTASIEEYIDLWISNRGDSISSLDQLATKITGYLHLDIQKKVVKKRLPEITYKDAHGNAEQYYIVSGVYISPWARSILHDNEEFIFDYLLDTTWKIMFQFVTSILMASSYNVGIPLGFGFGKGEEKQLYMKLLQAIQTQLDIQLKNKVIESDQGSALKALAKELEIINIAYLRHLLVSLKYNEHTYLLSNLIKATTQEEYDGTIAYMIQQYDKMDWKNKKATSMLVSVLKKVALKYMLETKQIQAIDKERWESVALLYRVSLRMPSTTNALEPTHGHLNKKTPRRNNFYMSIMRIVQSMMKKSQTIEKCIQNNYSYAKKNTKRYNSMRDETRIQNEIRFYCSTRERCTCNENKLLSAMFYAATE